MEQYQPELGQALFGQPSKEYECPRWMIAYLDAISHELDRVMWNIHQKTYESPFSNTGQRFKNDVFEVQAYSWDEDEEQSYNFKWREVEISWYKHSHRGTSINMHVAPFRGIQMLNECLASIQAMDKQP
jgi:hypothetical protein